MKSGVCWEAGKSRTSSARGECVAIKGGAACIAGATGTTARTRACSTSTATTPAPTPTRTSASAPLLPCLLMSCEPRLCRSTKAKGTHFPADKAKDERPRSSPVNYWGRRANRAGWPFLLYAGEGRPRSCGVAAVGKRQFQGVSHAGLFIKTWKE